MIVEKRKFNRLLEFEKKSYLNLPIINLDN